MPEIVMRLAVRDLEPGDLSSCAWSGPATHLAAIARALERARLGEVEYLAACPPSGLPMGLGAIDYATTAGAGTIWMLAVHPALRSCGIGTVLIQGRSRLAGTAPRLPGRPGDREGRAGGRRRRDAGEGIVKATDTQVASWRGSGKTYQKIAAEIAEWARSRERGSVLPGNEVFGRKADVEASPSTYKRAKQFLVTHGVLETNDGPFYVA